LPAPAFSCLEAVENPFVRFIYFYLVIYFALIAGAVYALWRAQVLQRMPSEWVGLSVVVSVSLGLLLALLSYRPAPIQD
jgi:hypothetical protein